MSKKLRYVGLALILLVSTFLAACGSSDDKKDVDLQVEKGKDKLTIPYVNWARETPVTYLLAEVLEDVGYDVDVKQVEAGPMYPSVADGSADFHAAGWLPTTHKDYREKNKDDRVKVPETLDKGARASGAPQYVKAANSLEQVKDDKKRATAVKNESIGIDARAGSTESTNTALKEYGLDDWKLASS